MGMTFPSEFHSPSTDARAAALRRTRRAFAWCHAREGALIGTTVGAAVAAAAVLLVRAFCAALPPAAYGVLAALPLGTLVGILLGLRHTPSRATCAALTEDATHAGGLFLVADLPGADAWPTPPPVLPALPKPQPRSRLALGAALLLLGAVFAAPNAWFAAATPPAPVRTMPDLTVDVKQELEDLAREDQLPPEDLEELKEELARIAESATATDPGTTLDAVARLDQRIKALRDLKAADQTRLADTPPPDSLANAAEANQALRQMIDDSGWGTTLGGEERKPQPGDGTGNGNGDGDGDGDGDGEQVGSGSPARGRADAPMAWSKDPTGLGASKFDDKAIKAKPSKSDGVITVGESIVPDDPAKFAPKPRAAGTTRLGGRTEGTSHQNTVAPRHRGTVKRFFEMERKHP